MRRRVLTILAATALAASLPPFSPTASAYTVTVSGDECTIVWGMQDWLDRGDIYLDTRDDRLASVVATRENFKNALPSVADDIEAYSDNRTGGAATFNRIVAAGVAAGMADWEVTTGLSYTVLMAPGDTDGPPRSMDDRVENITRRDAAEFQAYLDSAPDAGAEMTSQLYRDITRPGRVFTKSFTALTIGDAYRHCIDGTEGSFRLHDKDADGPGDGVDGPGGGMGGSLRGFSLSS